MRGRSLRCAALACGLCALVVGLAGCASTNVSVLPPMFVKKGRPFLIAESPAYGWGVLSHPRLIKVSDNLIILLYYLGGDSRKWNNPGTREISGRSPAVSRDGGKTWVYGEENLDPLIAEYAYYWGYDIPTGHGTILGAHGRAIMVNREGAVVEGPWETTVLTNGFDSGGPWHRGDRLPDGRLVAASYADRVRWGVRDRFRYHFLTSADTGRTWSVESLVAGPADVPWGYEWPIGFGGANEPAVSALGQKDILCVARVGVQQKSRFEVPRNGINMVQSRSRDGGRTWRHKEMYVGGVYPRLYRMRNGVIALSFGRPGNNVMFSRTGGRNWTAEMAITSPDAKTSGYCDAIEVEPGRLLVVFDVNKTDLSGSWLWEPNLANGLYGVFVDVKTLW